MTTSPIKVATASDIPQIADALTLAFGADPTGRWVYPDPHQYLASFPEFVRRYTSKAFEHGTAYYVDDFLGAALWLPPDIHPDEEAVVEHIQNTVSESLQEEVFSVFEQMDSFRPDEPHWFLPLLGVDPIHQRKGNGSALMQHAVEPCDRDKKLAYLESSNPGNISLYKRHGFEVLGEIQVGTSPVLTPMLRKPR